MFDSDDVAFDDVVFFVVDVAVAFAVMAYIVDFVSSAPVEKV